MNEFIIFGAYEAIKFIICAMVFFYGGFKTGMTYTIKETIFYSLVIILFKCILSFAINLVLFHGLIWMAGQFGIVAQSNLVYAVIIVVLNYVFSSLHS